MNKEVMQFPNTLDEFLESYSFTDKKEVYTNGSELIPVFRIKQWEEHKQNNWNELKKWLEEVIKDIDKARKLHEEYSLSEERLSSKYFAYGNTLNKMQELEQGKDE